MEGHELTHDTTQGTQRKCQNGPVKSHLAMMASMSLLVVHFCRDSSVHQGSLRSSRGSPQIPPSRQGNNVRWLLQHFNSDQNWNPRLFVVPDMSAVFWVDAELSGQKLKLISDSSQRHVRSLIACGWKRCLLSLGAGVRVNPTLFWGRAPVKLRAQARIRASTAVSSST